MNVAFVLMKGFDGCGVSRFAIEHQKELRRTNNICDIYSLNNKYVRERAHLDKDIIYYNKFIDIDFSKYDILILNSYEKCFNEEDFNYYKSLKCTKVAMMHEITRGNVTRIDHIWDWIMASDLVSSFSDDMDFVRDLRTNGFPINKYFSFKMAMSDDDMIKFYNNSLIEKKNRLVYFGRWTSMKDPSRLFKYKELDPSLVCNIVGVERSIGAVYDIFKNDLCEDSKISFLNNIDDFNNFNANSSMVQVFPPANRDVAIQILCESLFGCSFYSLKNNKINNLGNRMEYTQIEISCSCLPVFDISWGKNTFDNLTGKSFYEIGNNAIYSDIDNLQISIDEMKELSNNKELYEKRRKNIFELVKRNYGSQENIKYFYDQINSKKNEKRKGGCLWLSYLN